MSDLAGMSIAELCAFEPLILAGDDALGGLVDAVVLEHPSLVDQAPVIRVWATYQLAAEALADELVRRALTPSDEATVRARLLVLVASAEGLRVLLGLTETEVAR